MRTKDKFCILDDGLNQLHKRLSQLELDYYGQARVVNVDGEIVPVSATEVRSTLRPRCCNCGSDDIYKTWADGSLCNACWNDYLIHHPEEKTDA
jgi:hypothetical protein